MGDGRYAPRLWVPASRHAPSPRPYPGKIASPEYPEGVVVRRVRSNGEGKWARERVYLMCSD